MSEFFHPIELSGWIYLHICDSLGFLSFTSKEVANLFYQVISKTQIAPIP